MLSDVQDQIPAQTGHPERFDYEYQRLGTANVFMFFMPFIVQPHVKETYIRTRLDWAHDMRELPDQIHSDAEKIIVVLDDLNTHISFKPDDWKGLITSATNHYILHRSSMVTCFTIEQAN